jgi:predicted DNA-binding transcriptional regulator YafY
MARSERLLDLIQALRRYRHPVSAAALADELGVSLRTVYRDVQTLIGQGATIEGEAGVGYVLKPGFVLPPLMFDDPEIEALVLGARWVMKRSDDAELSAAARNALAKIVAVLPQDLREGAEFSGLLAGPGENLSAGKVDLGPIRAAIRDETKLRIHYDDGKGKATDRVIWPIALGFFDKVRVVVGWCELREDFRHFRADRMRDVRPTGKRYPKRRRVLLKAWREANKIPEPF